MYFLLDKDYAIRGIARCIGISEIPFTQEHIELTKQTYNAKETIVFQGNDIPHHIEYDPVKNTIVEKIIAEETQDIEVLQEQADEVKIFDEDVAIEPDVFYFYIDKQYADTRFMARILATFEQPLLDPDSYFGIGSYMIKGKDMPHYITIQDGQVREATKYEKYKRGQYKLGDREVEFKNDIIYLEEGWYIEGDELKKVPRPDDMVKPVFNEVSHIWEETATNVEKAKHSYTQYMILNNPYDVRKMTTQTIIDDYWNYLDNLEGYINSTRLGAPISDTIPTPSEQLESFFNNHFTL